MEIEQLQKELQQARSKVSEYGMKVMRQEAVILRLVQKARAQREENRKLRAAFQPGDAKLIGFILSEWNMRDCGCEHCQEATAMLRRLAEAAKEVKK